MQIRMWSVSQTFCGARFLPNQTSIGSISSSKASLQMEDSYLDYMMTFAELYFHLVFIVILNIKLLSLLCPLTNQLPITGTQWSPYPCGGGKHVLVSELEAVHLLQDQSAVLFTLEEVSAAEYSGYTLGLVSLDEDCGWGVVGFHTPGFRRQEQKVRDKDVSEGDIEKKGEDRRGMENMRITQTLFILKYIYL